jgi:zinc transport system substrate-binding protein
VVNYPLEYFAQRIAGDLLDVAFPAMVGDPALWEPMAGEVARFQEADLILLNGAGYAAWATKVSLPSARIVDTGKPISDRFIRLEDAVTHSHGPGREHEHGGLAFTTWIDPELAIEQAGAILDAFERRWPEFADSFESGFSGLRRDLEALDADLKAITVEGKPRPLITSHPVYQYLERRYGLDARSVHWEPDQVPDETMIEELREVLSTHPAGWMVWENQPVPESVTMLTGLGLQSAVFDPCGNRPESGDYLTVMQRNVQEMQRVFRP